MRSPARNRPRCSTLPSAGFTNPVHQYGRSLGFSVTGGFVYRGSALPALVGSYLFADYGSGRIWRLVSNGSGGFTAQELLDTNLSISSFGQGNDGELYVVDIVGGGLYKLVDGGGAAPTAAGADAAVGHGLRGRVESEPARLGPHSVRCRGRVLVRRRCEGTLARDTERHVDRRRRRRRLHVPERHRAHEALPLERQLDRDAPVHAPSRRRLGRLYLRVERPADQRDARAGREDGRCRRAELDLPERQRLPHLSHVGRGLRARARELRSSITTSTTRARAERRTSFAPSTTS